METYKVLTREEIEVLNRDEVVALLDFMDSKGHRPSVGILRGYHYYRNYVKLHGPASVYSEEELRLLLRLTQWVNGMRAPLWFNPHVGGFDNACNFITFGKWTDRPDTVPWAWECTKVTWREDQTKPTLAEGLSRFYMAYLTAGMWASGPELIAKEVTVGRGHSDCIRLQGVAKVFHWEKLPLVAPTQGELDELIELYRRERAAQGKPHFPLLLKTA